MSTHPIASVDRLPPEILADIFSLEQDQPVDLDDFPRTVLLVCRSWQNIAFNAPQLWSSFSLDLNPYETRNRLGVWLGNMKFCLERSKGHPLAIHIMAYTKPALELVPLFLELCARHAHRWEKLDVTLPFMALEPFISNPDIGFPQLRFVACWGGGGTVARTQDSPTAQLFRDAPRLSKLVLSHLPYPVSSLGLPWSQITDFTTEIVDDNLAEVLDLLRSMPNIVSARFFVDVIGKDLTRTEDVVMLPHLRLLSWRARDDDTSLFFDVIYAPRLSELEFYSMNDSMITSLQRFVKRSRCNITKLTLPSVTSQTPLSILSSFPSIETLTFSSCYGYHPELTCDASDFQGLVPRLKRIILETFSGELSPGEGFVSMLESRFSLPDGCRLESVQVGFKWSKPDGPSKTLKFIQERISPQYHSLITDDISAGVD